MTTQWSPPAAPPLPDGRATDAGNAAPPVQVGAMFDRIAPVYDLMNLIISGFQEPRWRRRAVAATGLEPGMAAIDVATGTGKVAASLGDRVGPLGRVLGVDLSPRMIERANATFGDRAHLEFVTGDAMDLPADDATFDAATIAFGMRNLPDYERGFAEMRRVVRPGGRVVCLEIARPNHLIARIARVWFEKIVPVLGRLAGQGGAYAYLVQSVQNYPEPDRIAAIMRDAGLVDVSWTPMTLGMVTVHVGTRAPDVRPGTATSAVPAETRLESQPESWPQPEAQTMNVRAILIGGIAASLVIAMWEMIVEAVIPDGVGFFGLPIAIGATIFRDLQGSANPIPFDLGALVVGLAGHMMNSVILAVVFGLAVRGRNLGVGPLVAAGMAWGVAVYVAMWFVILPAIDELMLNANAAVFFVGHLMWGAALGYLWSRFSAAASPVSVRTG